MIDDFGRVVEIPHVGDDHAVARGEAADDFDFGDRGGAELHRHAHRAVVAHHVQGARGVIDERAALELQHVVALVEHDAHGGALVLAQARRLIAGELHAARHLALAHFRRDRGDECRRAGGRRA